jgi:hypothetical protein
VIPDVSAEIPAGAAGDAFRFRQTRKRRIRDNLIAVDSALIAHFTDIY